MGLTNSSFLQLDKVAVLNNTIIWACLVQETLAQWGLLAVWLEVNLVAPEVQMIWLAIECFRNSNLKLGDFEMKMLNYVTKRK